MTRINVRINRRHRSDCRSSLIWICGLFLASCVAAQAEIVYDDSGRVEVDYNENENNEKENENIENEFFMSSLWRDLSYRKRRRTYATLSDIWLCLACALGWSVWFVSTRHSQELEPCVYEQNDSLKVMGHVLQVSLGEDADGTGIPIYHALVDYVVESELIDEEPLQVRKCFSTCRLLEAGFANVEVLVLAEDPTTSILMDDYLDEKKAREKQQKEPPNFMYTVVVCIVAVLLIVTSIVGGLHASFRLHPDERLYGWVSLGVGTLMLYPSATGLYYILTVFGRWSGSVSERRGIIIHGASNWDCGRICGATLNPMEVFDAFDDEDGNGNGNGNAGGKAGGKAGGNADADGSPQKTVEMHNLKIMQSMDTNQIINNSNNAFGSAGAGAGAGGETRSPLYPNAGCGFGNFNVHISSGLNRNDPNNRQRTSSSVSSMSSTATGQSNSNQSSSAMSLSLVLPSLSLMSLNANRPTESILEKYEQAVHAAELEEGAGTTTATTSIKSRSGIGFGFGFGISPAAVLEEESPSPNTNTNTNHNANEDEAEMDSASAKSKISVSANANAKTKTKTSVSDGANV